MPHKKNETSRRPGSSPLTLALGLASCLSPLTAAAQTASSNPPSTREHPLPEISVTATRTPRRIDEVPGTVTVIPAREIEKSGARDIKDVFRDELDVTVRQQANRYNASGGTARAGNEGINVRGLEGNQVLILADGIRAPSRFTFGPIGTSRGDFLNIDSARTIEVLRGPASTQYGSDGLAGVVSLRTPDPVDLLKKGQSLGGFVRFGHASVDSSFNVTVGGAIKSGDWRALLMATQRQGHELDNQGTVDAQDATRTTSNPADYSAPSVLGKVFYTLSPAHEIGLTVEALQRKTDTEVYSGRGTTTSRGVTTVVSDMDAHDKLERNRVSLEHRHEDDGGTLVQRAHTHVYAQDSTTRQLTLTDRTVAGVAPPLTRDSDYCQQLAGVSTQLEGTFSSAGARHRLTYGGDLNRTEETALFPGVVATGKLFPDTTYTLVGAFVQDEIEWAAFSIVPGLRYDRFKLSADPAGFSGTVVSLSDSAVTPRLGAVWKLADAFSPYVHWAKGFRAPTPSQVNNGFENTAAGYRSEGNPNLKPERADSLEVGLHGRVDGLRYQLLGYDNRYEDFISQQVVGGTGIPGVDPLVFQYVNFSKARIRGLEARAEWRIGKAWLVKAGAALSRGHTEANGVKTPLDTIEPLRTVLGLRYEAGTWDLRADALHVQHKQANRISTSTTASTADDYFATPPYTVLNLGASWKPLAGLTLIANLNNVFDKKYWNWSDVRGQLASSTVLDAYTAPGRNVQVSACYEF